MGRTVPWKGANEMAKKQSAFILTVMLAFALLMPMPAYAWGDNIGDRDTYSLQEVNGVAESALDRKSVV